jgi:pimeloyl-ACP methyl ester carboxylesterase
MAKDIQEFIQQQKLDKCVLIGHSMYVMLLHLSNELGIMRCYFGLFVP